jgi:hypothetical protein
MSWVAPRTWTTGEIVTAAVMNTHVRDNFLQTAPAVASAAGDIFVATAANAIKALTKGTALQYLRTNSGATDLEWATANFFKTDTTNTANFLTTGGVGAWKRVYYASAIAAETTYAIDVDMGFSPKVALWIVAGSNGYGQISLWAEGITSICSSFSYSKEGGSNKTSFWVGGGSRTTSTSEQFGTMILGFGHPYITSNTAKFQIRNHDTGSQTASIDGIVIGF